MHTNRQAELPHLAEAIERALKLLLLGAHVSLTQYGNLELLDALINERGSRGVRHSLILTVFRYIALEDEPRLAAAAMELSRLMIQERDSELYQVLCTEASVSVRNSIITACASWVRSAGGHLSPEAQSISSGVLSLLLDSLARADVEACLAHFLLGFTPFKIASSNLNQAAPHTALLQLICETCQQGDWISDWTVLECLRAQAEEEKQNGGEHEQVLVTHAMQLEFFQRRQVCMEAIYHMTRHQQTQAPALALLCNGSDYVRDRGTLLLAIAASLPRKNTCKGDIAQRREEVRRLREPPSKEPGAPFQSVGGGRLDLSVTWDKLASDVGAGDADDCEKHERVLGDILESHLGFYHQAGWFLRTCAAVLRNASSDTGLVSRDTVKALLRLMFGSADAAGGASTGTLSLWSAGHFQSLLDEAMDVPELEIQDAEVSHEALEPADLDECGKPVDRWSDDIMMYDEKLLHDRLSKRLLLKSCVLGDAREERGALDEAAEKFVSRKILSAYDGYNTLRRCRSARQHLLCGLQVCLVCAFVCVCVCVLHVCLEVCGVVYVCVRTCMPHTYIHTCVHSQP
jgi:hypothetical protein